MNQEIIKVREYRSYKVIPLKLILDIAPSSSADITRVLRGCFREGSVYVYLGSFQSKENLQEGRTGGGRGAGVSGTVHEPKKLSITVHGYKNFVFPNRENKKV